MRTNMSNRLKSCLVSWLRVLAVFLAIGFVFFVVVIRPWFDCISLKENGGRGAGVWIAILSANSEREGSGKPPVWPQDLRFDHTRTSTDYFR